MTALSEFEEVCNALVGEGLTELAKKNAQAAAEAMSLLESGLAQIRIDILLGPMSGRIDIVPRDRTIAPYKLMDFGAPLD